MGCSIIRECLAAFHSETTEKIDHFAKWCIYFIYHLQSGVYAIYTTCASIGKMAPLVYIYIYILTVLVKYYDCTEALNFIIYSSQLLPYASHGI